MFILKNNVNIALKETFSFVWAVSFGVTVAFIGQIYHFEENLEMYLLLWLFSTLFIIYIFDSLTSVCLYIVLLTTY
ncbi:MAG: DUF2157 domain-containing protein, partial [Actinobacteria bacterium]|nr:DUF2157 domain-containing protein [Actinomycetota bacterium]